MADIKEIAVRVGADITPLEKGFKTAGERVKGFKGSVAGAAKSIAAVTAAAAAAGAAVAAMANTAAESAREIKNLSRLSGSSAEEFQKMAFAAKTVGIEQDKLADIFKDVSDKVGDFLQTGGGPLADFFENIAPKVGVTAEQFRNLSGPAALQKYVDSLEKANVSQNEMTFYMEAIASDATALAPLLKDGGAAFAALGTEAEKAGAVLSGMDIEKLDQMKVAFDKVAEVSKVGATSLAAEFAPVLGALADEFTRLRIESNNFGNASEKVFQFSVKAVGVFADGLRGVQVIAKGLEVAFWGFSTVLNTVLGHGVAGLEQLTNGAIASINAIIEGFNKLPGVADMALLPFSNLGGTILEGAETAKTNMDQAISDLHDIMMKPLPSDKIDNFVAAAVEAYEGAAQASIDAVTGGGDAASSPVVKATEDITKAQLSAYKEYYAARKQAADDAAKVDSDIQKLQLSDASSFFGNLSSLMQTENKKMFQIGKAAAQGQAVIDTIASAQSAYKSLAGIPVVGPALGVAAAGAAIAAGMVRVNQIASTSFGANSVPGGAGGSSSVSTAAAEGQAGSAAAGSSSTLFVEGLSGEGIMSMLDARQLAETMLQYQRDGGEVVLV